eukprot:c14978_g1_i1.p1 GENE.c14978_g1_i1~~c14978_g1_i1.p1  ORF type:complete len:136 (+),score=74.15 c14978_g1_i1:37-444(+)
MGDDNPEKRTLYVGGLADEVDEEKLRGAFIPFGDLVSVNLPRDMANQKHRGFGFVEFEEIGDAKAAIENMNDSELFGRVLKVNLSKPMKDVNSKAVWHHDDYLVSRHGEEDEGENKNENKNEENGHANKKQKIGT